ncbi:MAG: ATP-grasp domain-containing protein [Treponema sp.]|nr:ATP-grasp domain-containing protein [Treponema sp.]
MNNMNTEKSVLILGAGLMQRPAILAAKELGFKVYLIDANPKALCVNLADEFKPIDLKDRQAIADYAVELKKNNGLKAVFTAGTDFSASVSYASKACGLKSHEFEAAVNASNKYVMRQRFKECNVPSPDFIQIPQDKISEILTPDYISKINFPVVVKPVDNMGARGCRMIRSQEELTAAVEDAVNCSRTKTAIFEEYMEGPEFSIDALVYDGTMTITGFADRHIYFPPYFIETGHTMPVAASEDVKKVLIKTFAQGVAALGLSCGAAKADIKFTKNGPMIGEIAGRLSGGYMSGWTYPYASGLNLTKEALKIAAGIVPDELEKNRIRLDIDSPFELYDVPCNSVCAERAWISIPGVLKKIHGLDAVSKMECIRDVFPRNKEGDTVTFPRNNVEKCGNVLSFDRDYEKAVKAAHNAIANIVLELEYDNDATTAFLEGRRSDTEKNFADNAFDFDSETLEKILCEVDKHSSQIPENISIREFVPEILGPYLDRCDFNHRSMAQTLQMFDELKSAEKSVESKKFWTYLIRGGIQGALYAQN